MSRKETQRLRVDLTSLVQKRLTRPPNLHVSSGGLGVTGLR